MNRMNEWLGEEEEGRSFVVVLSFGAKFGMVPITFDFFVTPDRPLIGRVS